MDISLERLDAAAEARLPNDTGRRTTVADVHRRLEDMRVVLMDLTAAIQRAELDRAPPPWIEVRLGKRAGQKKYREPIENLRALLGIAREGMQVAFDLRMPGDPRPESPPAARLLVTVSLGLEPWDADVSQPTAQLLRASPVPVRHLDLVEPAPPSYPKVTPHGETVPLRVTEAGKILEDPVELNRVARVVQWMAERTAEAGGESALLRAARRARQRLVDL